MSVQSATRIQVKGVVQGVGFRPFVYRLASELGLVGDVRNDASGVLINLTGPVAEIDLFLDRMSHETPPLAQIDTVTTKEIRPFAADHFSIAASDETTGDRTLISPDSAVCRECVDELFNPTDRRFGHPFITCTNCGPRVSIIADLPYDRHNTTMVTFEMCATCRREYDDPADRRYHAQPIGCHDCGPHVSFASNVETLSDLSPIQSAAKLIKAGGILAVKGIGGYHLMCDAENPSALAELRRRKSRPDKPFAIMVDSTETAQRYAELDELEVQELSCAAAPIVLARQWRATSLPGLVAPGSPLVGVMLAYTPMHHLLLEAVAGPVVVTSANPAGAPLVHERDHLDRLGFLFDAVLDHNRDIRVPVDDSVVRRVGDEIVPLRRARGYAPIPASLVNGKSAVLAVGGELKNTFCLANGERAWVSQHIGDMENLETLQTFERMVSEYQTMYVVEPEVVAVDAHPGYLSSKWARRTLNAPIIEVQHHHAHVAAVMAEHELDPYEPVLGVAFDGTGYGEDGTIWGGEILVATAEWYTRVGHLRPIQLPGGDAAVKNPSRVALAHLAEAGIEWAEDLAPVAQLSLGEQALLSQQLARKLNCVPTTSMGRLFDAVASLVGVRHAVSYEAQAAIELEILAGTAAQSEETVLAENRYHFAISADGVIDQTPVLAAIVSDLRQGMPVPEISWFFHDAVARAVDEICCQVGNQRSLGTVALSGGVFQNSLLLQLCCNRLAHNFDVRTHRLIPANDGGLSLGQAFVATHSIQNIPIRQES